MSFEDLIVAFTRELGELSLHDLHSPQKRRELYSRVSVADAENRELDAIALSRELHRRDLSSLSTAPRRQH